MIKPSTIDLINESALIEDVVAKFVKLDKKGSNYLGLCPFHNEKTPSFVVNPNGNYFNCFGCGEGGNSISFLMKHQSLNYPEALKYLAKKYNITIEESIPSQEQEEKEKTKHSIIEFNLFVTNFFISQLNLPQNTIALDYANSRFNSNSISQWQIGYANDNFTALYDRASVKGYDDEFLISTGLVKRSKKNNRIYDFFNNRLIFPIFDKHGNVISFSGRILPDSNSKFGKYINLAETNAYKKSHVLYGLNFLLKTKPKSNTITVVEGNTDCIKLREIGINNTVASSGTTLSIEQISLLKRFSEKQILLFDGDGPGKDAMINNGIQFVGNGLSPYAALLPKKQDPDSFFTSKDHFNSWIKKNQFDFISWYTNTLFENIGNDPSLKDDAINKVCDLLIHLSNNKQQLYLEQITLSSKLKGKLFLDRLKELQASNANTKKTKTIVPNDIDPNEFEKWGFYVENNAYHFRIKDTIIKLSNFVMKPIFHIDSINDSKRIYELINEYGHRVVVKLDMNEMTSLQGFQRNVESKGNFIFWGQMGQFQKLKLKLYEETRTCIEIKNLGWQKEGFWSWANGKLDKGGDFIPIDEYGVITHDNQNYFIPAFSKIYIKDKSIFLDERKFQYKKSDVSLESWMNLYLKVHGENAMVGFAWYLASLFRDHILYLNDNFPLLNLFGQKGSGKNTLAYSLLSLFGKKQTEFNIHNGTKPGLAKHLEMFSNSIAFIDEYKNSLDFDKIETLKSIYNAIGRSRLNMDKGGKKEITEVNQAVIVAGQEMPTIDIALSSRMIFLQFLSKEGLSKDAKHNFEELQEMERDGLSHISAMFLAHREYFIKFYKENYDLVMLKLTKSTASEEINDRLLRNMCTVIAAFKTLEPKFNFSFSYKELFSFGIEVTREHSKQIKQSDEIGIFWNLLEAMFDDNLLINNWHFKIKIKHSIKTINNTINFPEGRKIFRFKFNTVAKMYAEQLRRRNEKPLPQDSLKHYLKTNKHFIGIEKSCKYTRKDYIIAENRIVEQSQTTTAFCFDYNALNINLERDGLNPPDSHSESSTIKSPKDNLPF